MRAASNKNTKHGTTDLPMIEMTRRTMLKRMGYTAAVCVAPLPAVGTVIGTASEARRLSFYHTHTRISLELVYHDGHRYVPEALTRINTFLSDFRTKDVHPIDPDLLDLLLATRTAIGTDQRFEVISGYRSPATNEMLRHQGASVAKASLHMQGRAIDVRLTNTQTNHLRQAALDLGRGGVGYYPQSDFIHLDTGDVRSW